MKLLLRAGVGLVFFWGFLVQQVSSAERREMGLNVSPWITTTTSSTFEKKVEIAPVKSSVNILVKHRTNDRRTNGGAILPRNEHIICGVRTHSKSKIDAIISWDSPKRVPIGQMPLSASLMLAYFMNSHSDIECRSLTRVLKREHSLMGLAILWPDHRTLLDRQIGFCGSLANGLSSNSHIAGFSQSPKQSPQANAAHSQSPNASNQKTQRPRRHILLGLQVIFGALLLLCGLSCLNQANKLPGARDTDAFFAATLGILLIVAGSLLAFGGLAFTIVHYNPY